MNIGELRNWDIDAHLKAARELVRSDDVLLALDLLSTHLPAYFRQFPPKEVTELRNEILKRIATPEFYSNEEAKCHFENVDPKADLLRSRLVLEDCQKYNNDHKIPHVVDWGPGCFHIPLMLFNHGCAFTYKPIVINPRSATEFFDQYPYLRGDPDPEDPRVFLGLEILEHLQNPADLKSTMMREVGLADVVHISTPAYSFDGSERPMADVLGHLRALTPNDMVGTIYNLFTEYNWAFYNGPVMHMRLEKK